MGASFLNHSSITILNLLGAFLYSRPENNLLSILPTTSSLTPILGHSHKLNQPSRSTYLCLPLRAQKTTPTGVSDRATWRSNVEAIVHQLSLDLSSNPPSPKPKMQGQYGSFVFSRKQWRERLTCKKGVTMPLLSTNKCCPPLPSILFPHSPCPQPEEGIWIPLASRLTAPPKQQRPVGDSCSRCPSHPPPTHTSPTPPRELPGAEQCPSPHPTAKIKEGTTQAVQRSSVH